MSITAHVYEQNALVTLAKYGIQPTIAYSPNQSQYFVLVPCSTDVSEFDVNFTGNLTNLLSSGVIEVSEASGYTRGAITLPDTIFYTYQNALEAVTNYSLYGGADWTARNYPSQFVLESKLGYGAVAAALAANRIYSRARSTSTYSYRSLVLAWTMAQYTTGFNVETRYANSYPIAMFDMGGLSTTNTYWNDTLDISWGGDSTISWTLA